MKLSRYILLIIIILFATTMMSSSIMLLLLMPWRIQRREPITVLTFELETGRVLRIFIKAILLMALRGYGSSVGGRCRLFHFGINIRGIARTTTVI